MTSDTNSPRVTVRIGNFDFAFEGSGEELRRQLAEGARAIADLLDGKSDAAKDLGGAGVDPLKGR